MRSTKMLLVLSLILTFIIIAVSFFTTTKIFQAGQLYNGLLVWYKFEEESGSNVHDSSGNGNDGTIDSIEENFSWFPGKSGNRSLYLGISSCVFVPVSTPGGNAISMALWIKPTDYNQMNTIVTTKYEDIEKDWLLILSENEDKSFSVIFIIGDEEFVSNSTIHNNVWTHIAFTFDENNNYTLYINGTEDIQYTTRTPFPGLPDMLHLGSYKWPWYNMIGCFDDFQVYSRALGDEEINQIYKNSLMTPSPTPTPTPSPMQSSSSNTQNLPSGSPSSTPGDSGTPSGTAGGTFILTSGPVTATPNESPSGYKTFTPGKTFQDPSAEPTSIPGNTKSRSNITSLLLIISASIAVMAAAGAGIFLIIKNKYKWSHKE